MRSFAKRIAHQSQDTIYCIHETGDGDIDMYSCLLAVAPYKEEAFKQAMKGNEAIRAEDYGRVVYYGAGALTEESIQEILNQGT
jgi:hypothetical protein